MISNEEGYSKVFLVLADDATADGGVAYGTRKCLCCDRVFTRQASYEHSKTICYPPASAIN
jgi:hypothetical protein